MRPHRHPRPSRGSPRVLFGWNISDWTGHYAEARLSRYDPTIQAVFTSPSAFTWAEIGQRHPEKASPLGVR